MRPAPGRRRLLQQASRLSCPRPRRESREPQRAASCSGGCTHRRSRSLIWRQSGGLIERSSSPARACRPLRDHRPVMAATEPSRRSGRGGWGLLVHEGRPVATIAVALCCAITLTSCCRRAQSVPRRAKNHPARTFPRSIRAFDAPPALPRARRSACSAAGCALPSSACALLRRDAECRVYRRERAPAQLASPRSTSPA